jgi:adenylate cyclase
MSDGTHRKLAAIISADVVGYSLLMGKDEANTLAALRQWRAKEFEPAISSSNGRVVKNMGDGWLVEFDSAGDAVTCAIQVQEKLSDHETLKLRIGLHIGDITHADGDIYGDGVNIAARLQEIAEPGAIVISDVTRRSIDGKLATVFSDLGQQELKNIAEPITAFGWGMTTAQAVASPLPLPDKPSIAVLPFENMSGDPEQEYFSDGITEDIITALSKFRWFFVTARNSTFTYKGTAIDIKQVGRELGVRYVLEGSVRKGGNRVRITAQLIEAETGNHIWAERYDRELDDIFELQDEITQTIAAAVEPELAGSERNRVLYRPTQNLQAYDLMHQGVARLLQLDHGPSRVLEAIDLLKQAIVIDPNFGAAYGRLALFYYGLLALRWAERPEETLQEGIRCAKQAMNLDRQESKSRCRLTRILHRGITDWQSLNCI